MTSPPELHLARRCRCWKGGREGETKGGREGGYYKGRTGVIEGRGIEGERERGAEGGLEGETKGGSEGGYYKGREGGMG